MTIRAVQVEHPHDAFVRNRLRYAFELTDPGAPRRFYGRTREDGYDGWFDREQLGGDGLGDSAPESYAEIVFVDLPRDLAAALADAILTEAHGTPAGDVRALRADLDHERDRRDALEDRMIEALDRLIPVVSGQHGILPIPAP